uniref:Uncharacterized protein n=1 Tax=Electrophorus electricus TaxID=8005 RepID=A0AAY5EW62_ELEEL
MFSYFHLRVTKQTRGTLSRKLSRKLWDSRATITGTRAPPSLGLARHCLHLSFTISPSFTSISSRGLPS